MKRPDAWKRRAKYSATLAERLALHSDRSGGPDSCWLWVGALGKSGYGSLRVDGRTLGAHRVSYEEAIAPIPSGLMVRHSCDVRACINPAHLSVGTNRDNCLDREARGRGRWSKIRQVA